MLGAHGTIPGKSSPYDEATPIPLIVGSPGDEGPIEAGRRDGRSGRPDADAALGV